MKRHFDRVLLLLLLIVVTACNSTSTPTATQLTPTLANTPNRAAMNEAQRTVADFLNAWVSDNYDAMYNLLTANSRDANPRDDFEKLYRDTEKTITLMPAGKSYSLASAISQGESVDVAYDMSFKTQLFGEFTDPGRVMHVVSTPEGWRVGWTAGDVIAEFNSGAVLDIQQSDSLRGNIYGRDGEVLADMNGQSLVVTLRTKEYKGAGPEACFTALAAVFPLRTAEQMKTLFSPLTGKDYAFEVGELSLERFQEVHTSIEANCTLDYANRPTRRYMAGGLAPHIIGYVGRIPAEQAENWIAKGYSPDALIGIDGIERYWEDTLAGRGEAVLNIMLRGQVVRVLARRAPVRSQSVYLTLHRSLQEELQFSLKDAFTSAVWGSYSPGAAVVVMNVKTGEILAIASYPDFDVDAFNPHTQLKNAQELIAQWSRDPRKPTFNRATLGQYPAGSTFKIVTMAAAADSGQFNMNTRYTCTGIWYGEALGDRRREDWIASTAARQHGNITLQQALEGSCNIYFWHIGWTLNGVNPTIVPDYARRMGLGVVTGIKGVAESTGAIPDVANWEKLTGRKWTGSDALNMAIGQGEVLVTPLQMARLVAAVANGGTLWEPQIISKVGIIGEPSYVAAPKAVGQLDFKPGILQGIRDAMCKVVTDPTYGTAYFVFKDFKGGAVICGKTGTAESGSGLPHAWFVAYAGKTADDPEIAISVIVEKSNEGSFIAAPIARRVVELYFGLTVTPWPSWYGSPGELPTPGLD